MIGLLGFVLAVLASPFKSRLRLEAENAALRHQLMVLRRRLQGRIQLTNHDRWFLIQLYRWFPSILSVLTIVRPETLVRWHRAGFRCYWRRKSRPLGGRPQIDTELRVLIWRIDAQLDESKIAIGVMRSLKELAETEWATYWGAVREVSDRLGGNYHLPGHPWHFSESTPDETAPAAFQGEHNEAILREIGLTQVEIDECVATKMLISNNPLS
jgi:hypothetical protein